MKKDLKNEGKKPFFAKFLENQMEAKKVVGARAFAATAKYPSDTDEDIIILIGDNG